MPALAELTEEDAACAEGDVALAGVPTLVVPEG